MISCNQVDQSQEEPSNEGTYNTTESGETLTITQLYARYVTFEDCISDATDIVKAKCIDVIESSKNVEYEFSVTESFLGESKGSNIFVFVQPDQMVEIISGAHKVNESDNYQENLKYSIGSEYYLILMKHIDVYYDHDRYMVAYSAPFIPAADVSSSTMYGESILKHSSAETLKTEEDLREYITKCISDIDWSKKLGYYGIPYITNTDAATIIEKSMHVLKIKITEQKYANKSGNKNIYLCSVTETLKGTVKKDETIGIEFFPDTISIGEEYIIALNDVDYTSTPQTYIFSSKNSLFSTTEYESILEIINQE